MVENSIVSNTEALTLAYSISEEVERLRSTLNLNQDLQQQLTLP